MGVCYEEALCLCCCRRKKKCIRFKHDNGSGSDDDCEEDYGDSMPAWDSGPSGMDSDSCQADTPPLSTPPPPVAASRGAEERTEEASSSLAPSQTEGPVNGVESTSHPPPLPPATTPLAAKEGVPVT